MFRKPRGPWFRGALVNRRRSSPHFPYVSRRLRGEPCQPLGRTVPGALLPLCVPAFVRVLAKRRKIRQKEGGVEARQGDGKGQHGQGVGQVPAVPEADK